MTHHGAGVPGVGHLGLRVDALLLGLSLLLLLQLLLALVDQRVQHRLDVLVQVAHGGVVLALGDEQDVTDVRQARHHALLQLLDGLGLLLHLAQFRLLLAQLLLVFLVRRDARQRRRVPYLKQKK